MCSTQSRLDGSITMRMRIRGKLFSYQKFPRGSPCQQNITVELARDGRQSLRMDETLRISPTSVCDHWDSAKNARPSDTPSQRYPIGYDTTNGPYYEARPGVGLP